MRRALSAVCLLGMTFSTSAHAQDSDDIRQRAQKSHVGIEMNFANGGFIKDALPKRISMGYTLNGHIGISETSFFDITVPFALLSSSGESFSTLGNIGLGYSYARSQGSFGSFFKAELYVPLPGVGLYIDESTFNESAYKRFVAGTYAGTFDHAVYRNNRWALNSLGLNIAGGWELHSGDVFVYRGDAAVATSIPLAEGQQTFAIYIEQSNDFEFAIADDFGAGLRLQENLWLHSDGMEFLLSTGPFVSYEQEDGLYARLGWLLTFGDLNDGGFPLNAVKIDAGYTF